MLLGCGARYGGSHNGVPGDSPVIPGTVGTGDSPYDSYQSGWGRRDAGYRKYERDGMGLSCELRPTARLWSSNVSIWINLMDILMDISNIVAFHQFSSKSLMFMNFR